MNFSAVNPHIRFAEQLSCKSVGNTVFVKDCRIFYILSGRGKIVIEEKSYDLVPDSLFYCRENSVYSIISEGITLLSLNFDLTQKNAEQTESFSPVSIEGCKTLHIEENEKIIDCDSLNSHIFIEKGKHFYDAINTIISEYKFRRIYFREKCGGNVKSLLADIACAQTLPTDNSNKAVEQAINYINANFKKNFTNKQLAKMIGYHEYHLNRLFLKHTGQSIHKYVLGRRLSEAKKLLLSSELPLSEIAELSGFNSYAYFSYYFKQANDITPFQYRAMYKTGI